MHDIKQYRKKPVVIDAIQWDGTPECATPIIDWILSEGERSARFHNGVDDLCIKIDTLEGTMKAEPYDFIIKGVQGEFYPCKPDIFEQTYEEVTDLQPLDPDTNSKPSEAQSNATSDPSEVA